MEYAPSPALVEAATYLSTAPFLSRVSTVMKLELYGLYKHITVAPVPSDPRPSLFDLTGRAKWDAWNNVGKTYAGRGADAEKRYLEIARDLGWVPGHGIAREEGEVWDDDLGVSVSRSASAQSKSGMGGSVSAMPAAALGDDLLGGPPSLHNFAIQGDADKIARALIDDPFVDLDKRDKYGYTPLHLACDRGNLAAVKVLIKHGAGASIKDPDDLTGMELAQIAGHDEICAFLQAESKLRY